MGHLQAKGYTAIQDGYTEPIAQHLPSASVAEAEVAHCAAQDERTDGRLAWCVGSARVTHSETSTLKYRRESISAMYFIASLAARHRRAVAGVSPQSRCATGPRRR